MTASSYRTEFTAVFERNFDRLFRALDRMSGDPDLAGDLAQETFIRLYRRGSLPESPEAWLITVALNLFRNARRTGARRAQLLTAWRARSAHGDGPAAPTATLDAGIARRNVRAALDSLDERARQLLLLRAEGFSYREIARGLGLHEASVGQLVARARQAFRDAYRELE